MFTYAGERKPQNRPTFGYVKVYKFSVLFMVAMLGNIHRSFTPGIDSTRVAEESTDFRRTNIMTSLGQKVANKVKSLFKLLPKMMGGTRILAIG